jgi:carbonic anhydrase/acetyltransferase-like protein (isoleucine patch superfamily)
MVMMRGCDIGEGSLFDIGSTILKSVKIGKNCTLIPEGKMTPDNKIVIGFPVKLSRNTTPNR